LANWHLELSAGQYGSAAEGKHSARKVKLVHNIVLSMPSPTPPEKVLAAARVFAREKFALHHRYALVLHTDQQHPHVHMVVKAEGDHGRRLHIDKAMLRGWREDFARMVWPPTRHRARSEVGVDGRTRTRFTVRSAEAHHAQSANRLPRWRGSLRGPGW
jgi:hypothetical protein